MKHLQKAPRKPLLSAEQGEVFISLLDDNTHKSIAKSIFIHGATNEEAATEHYYCKKQIERIRILLLKTALKKLIEKQIPKKPVLRKMGYESLDFNCPCCGNKQISQIGSSWIAGQKYKYCSNCGQTIDWSGT